MSPSAIFLAGIIAGQGYETLPLPQSYAQALAEPWVQVDPTGLTYRSDGTNPDYDEPIRPDELLRRGAGDCEDFAILLFHHYRLLGQEAFLAVGYLDNAAHAVLALPNPQGILYLDITPAPDGEAGMLRLATSQFEPVYLLDEFTIYVIGETR